MSQRYSSRLRKGRWTRGGTSSKQEALSGAGYDIEKYREEEEERWRQLNHAISLAVNYYQMRPVDNKYSKEVGGIITERAKKHYKRITGRDDDYIITMMMRTVSRGDIESCVLPPERKISMPTFSVDTFMTDDMFGPQEEEMEDAAATAAAAEEELNQMNGLIPYNFGQQEENNDTSYDEMMAQIFLFNGTPMSSEDPNAAFGGGSYDS